jgi:hypothetical protein
MVLNPRDIMVLNPRDIMVLNPRMLLNLFLALSIVSIVHYLDSCVGCISYSFNQFVILVIVSQSECTVDNATWNRTELFNLVM